MPRSRPDTLDLFEDRPPAAAPTRAPVAREEHCLPTMSDRAIVALLGAIMQEMERRIGSARASPDLGRALEETQAALRRLSRGGKRRPARGTGSLPLQPAKRKAVRAALVAGVKPREVAKHFGLSLAEVRKALAKID